MTYAARHGRSAASPSAADAHAQELVDAAQAWVDDDPDHETRVELGDLLAKATTKDKLDVALGKDEKEEMLQNL